MKITISEELKKYLEHKNKKNIVVEVMSTDHSDFDITEIYIRTCDFSHRGYLRDKKGYKEFPIENAQGNGMAVLFKPYKLEIADEVSFDLQKKWIFKSITYDGIKL